MSDDSSSDTLSTLSAEDNIHEIVEELKTDTCILARLDPLLRYPIFDVDPETKVQNYLVSTWNPEKLYADKVESRFPLADSQLAMQLGKTNYERYLRCQAERDNNESQEASLLALQDVSELAGTRAASSKFHYSGIGTSLGSTISYAETMMSYSYDGQSVRIPPLPEEATQGLPFSCLACGRTVSITNNSSWK